MIWFLLSVFNILCAYVAEKTIKKNKYISLLFLLFVIVANTIIIGLRDFGVGTDTLIYIDSYFLEGGRTTFKNIIFESYEERDKGFLMLAYISTMVSTNSQALLVVCELFIISFIIFGMYNLKKVLNYNMTIFMLLFCLLYQRESCNLMRQYCAMSLLFFGFSQLLSKRYFVYILTQILAYSFHTSSVIFLMIPVFYFFSNIQNQIKYYYAIAVFIGIVAILLFFYYFLAIIGDLNILKEEYASRYDENSNLYSYSGLSIRLLPYFILLVLIYFVSRHNTISNEIVYMLVVLVISNILLEQLIYVATVLKRTAYYIGLVSLVYLSMVYSLKNMYSKIIAFLYLVSVLVFAFNDYNKSRQTIQGGTYIYTSKILGL